MSETTGRGDDSREYLARKKFFDQFLTIYGRKPVLEALQAGDIRVERLHVADSARGGIIDRILKLGAQRAGEVVRAPAEAVTRISRDGKQDQGVAADLRLPGYMDASDYLAGAPPGFALLALDGVTTPRNVGMAVRSAAAGGMDGVILPRKGTCRINPLVVKASAGTLLRSTLLHCERLGDALSGFIEAGAEVCILRADADEDLFSFTPPARAVYVLGSESAGVSEAVRGLSARSLSIPMAEGVESLNVAVAAALVAYRDRLGR